MTLLHLVGLALTLVGLAALLLLLLLISAGLFAHVLIRFAAGILAFVKVAHDLILSTRLRQHRAAVRPCKLEPGEGVDRSRPVTQRNGRVAVLAA